MDKIDYCDFSLEITTTYSVVLVGNEVPSSDQITSKLKKYSTEVQRSEFPVFIITKMIITTLT
jgi:hypothetical protein